MAFEPGTCGFCGTGGGWLGDQGDEDTQYLHGAVRVGEPGNWSYESHPNESSHMTVIWCGRCVGGLKHKFQRYDDHNLRALYLSSKFRLELDGIRWGAWEADTEEELAVAKKYQDDPAVHLDKLRLERNIRLMRDELYRRMGGDLTQEDWRA